MSGASRRAKLTTTLTEEQAVERSGPGAGNKGREAAAAALEMAKLFRNMDEGIGG